ncbi:hypothetical protein [Aneurinibacillus migulanus]|uniref:YhfH-like protein n=1 Tax=Aneurinibacillus migulanus TaxID=47500 RepID=A0A1G8N0I8_ANEMI|nr:hypothetical protein [Aneurinibacillus migulanus]MED4731535.1 hypothetical protein [Aneurinibacillus migulanus]GED16092.1 hypothetical protein AMI01nite_40830 [Aneurinibacillus migulanus]SDI73605.1 hypothetical protein SAMN04487909_10745 [Aneurinibacillus migulanus]
MNIVFTEIKCQECGVKLTEYEVEEKGLYCMDCYEDKKEASPN